MTNYGATIVSVHQPTWFYQTSYKDFHEAYLDSPVAQHFLTQLTFNEITQLRFKEDFFYLKKISSIDDRRIIYITDQAITDTKNMEHLFERIKYAIGNVHDLSGMQEKEKSTFALKKILDFPDFSIDPKPFVERKQTPKSNILFFGPKDIPKPDDSDWLALDHTNRGGLYECD